MFETIVEYNGKQISIKELESVAKKQWVSLGNKVKELKTLKIYLNTNENKAYAIPNNKIEKQFIIEA